MNSLVSINNTMKTKVTSTGPLVLWLDAKDPAGNGTVYSSNTTFSTWVDKSGYGNNSSALTTSDVATTISYLATGFNSSYPTFNFTGNGNRFVGVLNGSSKITGNSTRCFVVGSLNSTTANFSRFIGFSQTYKADDYNTVSAWGFLRQQNTGMGPYRNGNYLANNPSGYNIPFVWESWFDGTNRYATFLNGASTVTNSNSSTGNFNIGFYAVGHNTNPADTPATLTGNISEILVYKGTLTTAQIQQTEAYLSYRWGLQSKLPSSNPYTSGPSEPYR